MQIQDHVIQKSKDLIFKMHAYATNLMDNYGEQYYLDETNEELGVNIRYRTFSETIYLDSSRWSYRLEGRVAFVDDEECQVGNIKWHAIVEAI
jgi:hypothetical protein